MRIIEKLNKLPIRAGDYLVLPNLETPYFVIPLISRDIFNSSLSLVKHKSLIGWFKKIGLQFVPLFLLRRFFSVITIQSDNDNDSSYQLILPWNQDVYNKFTIFNFNKDNITLVKAGFGKYRKMINNEYHSILTMQKFGKNIAPEVVGFYEYKYFTKIETVFYDGIHPNYLPVSIVDFFEKIRAESRKTRLIDHPYIKEILLDINNVLEKEGLIFLLARVNEGIKRYEDKLVPIVLMHADCSKTNVISTKTGENVLIDWEECVEEGIPIDIEYFDFRMHIDNGKTWKIDNIIDFLVVLHYIYLQIKYDNISQLEKVSWNNSEISI
tara:strand:+ start:3792 stop:4766 length:975 start_codon:yes stop_codon:yes gene_type:complete